MRRETVPSFTVLGQQIFSFFYPNTLQTVVKLNVTTFYFSLQHYKIFESLYLKCFLY